MKTPVLVSHPSCSVALLLVGLLTARSAEGPLPASEDLRAHFEVALPAHLEVATASFTPLGRPASKVRVQATVRALENLYLPPDPAAKGSSNATGTPCLRCVTRAGAVSPALNLEFSATNSTNGWSFGTISTNYFTRLGAPAAAYDVNLPTDDSPEVVAERERLRKAKQAEARRETITEVTAAVDALADTALKVRSAIAGQPVVTNPPSAQPSASKSTKSRAAVAAKHEPPMNVDRLLGGLLTGK